MRIYADMKMKKIINFVGTDFYNNMGLRCFSVDEGPPSFKSYVNCINCPNGKALLFFDLVLTFSLRFCGSGYLGYILITLMVLFPWVVSSLISRSESIIFFFEFRGNKDSYPLKCRLLVGKDLWVTSFILLSHIHKALASLSIFLHLLVVW